MTSVRPGPGPFAWDSPFVRALVARLARLEHPRTARGASFALLTVLDAENTPGRAMTPAHALRYRLDMLAWLVDELAHAARQEARLLRDGVGRPGARALTENVRALAEALATITEHIDTLLATHTSTPHTSRAA